MKLQARWLLAAVVLAAPVWAMVGCEHHYFSVQGAVATDGGGMGTWRSSPDGCSTDPDGKTGSAGSQALATFVWENPAVRDPNWPRMLKTDAPLRLQLRRGQHGLEADMETVLTKGDTRLDGSTCSVLQMTTHSGPLAIRGGRATTGGTLEMDCRVKASRVTADLKFEGCSF